MPSVKLKRCPFCDGTVEVVAGGFRPAPPTYYVYCRKCGASSGVCDTKKEAVAAWNKRVTDDGEDE